MDRACSTFPGTLAFLYLSYDFSSDDDNSHEGCILCNNNTFMHHACTLNGEGKDFLGKAFIKAARHFATSFA